jgi:putative transposase
MIAAAEKHSAVVGTLAACSALAVSRATLYRRRKPVPVVYQRRHVPRALSTEERMAVLAMLNTVGNVDKSPWSIYASLLTQGMHMCSPRTMYRILAANKQVRERRAQARHPKYTAPELLATGPNQLWSWDITKLITVNKWEYLFLYVMLDVFSRYVVGWLLAERENNELAQALIASSCAKQGIQPGQLTIHSDRGKPMTAKNVANLMCDLGVDKTHSRPHVSNDNPFIESHFKTVKYRPDFPDKFGGVHDGRAHLPPFFEWYNNEHQHSGIAYLTPASVHYGRAQSILVERQRALDVAYATRPERFVAGAPKVAPLPTAVWINPPKGPTLSEPGAPPEALVCPSPKIILPCSAQVGSSAAQPAQRTLDVAEHRRMLATAMTPEGNSHSDSTVI